MNYRGSGGFTQKLENEGYGQWGDKMLDDMIDATEWAIDNNIAIKDKIAIFGGSYGGYAALAQLAFNPDVFACGVSTMGVSNLTSFMYNDYGSLEEWTKIIGYSTSTPPGREFLAKRSPVNFVENIKKPLLIEHGETDTRVLIIQSEQMVEAMKEKNRTVTFIKHPDEGHGWQKNTNVISFFAVVENFLQKCLGGDAESLGEALDDSSIIIVEKGDMDILIKSNTSLEEIDILASGEAAADA